MSGKIRRTQDAAVHVVGNKSVLVAATEARVLNEAAARIWELAEGRTEDEVASLLAVEFDVSYDRALHDVRAFLAELEAGRLVRRDP